MEQMGLNQSDLLRYIPSKGRVSEILSGRRSLSLGMIRALQKGLKIPAEILLLPTSTRRAKIRGGARRKKLSR
jgi:HTH-type transcriptional regulator / antitoxin HigA